MPQSVAEEAIKALEANGYSVKMGRGAREEDLIQDVSDLMQFFCELHRVQGLF